MYMSFFLTPSQPTCNHYKNQLQDSSASVFIVVFKPVKCSYSCYSICATRSAVNHLAMHCTTFQFCFARKLQFFNHSCCCKNIVLQWNLRHSLPTKNTLVRYLNYGFCISLGVPTPCGFALQKPLCNVLGAAILSSVWRLTSSWRLIAMGN